MLNITITEQTPHNLLRAIRAACNELLGETHADLTTQAAQHNSRANELHAAAEAESDKAAACLTAHNVEQKAVTSATGAATMAAWDAPGLSAEPTPTVEMDSTGAEWDSELHASTKAKNQDGTWKKRRGARDPRDVVSDPEGKLIVDPSEPLIAAPAPSLPPIPPAPPAPTGEVVTMNEIWALITNGKSTLDKVLTAAQAMGFTDLGAVAQTATPEQRAALFGALTC